ncbi:tetratricopeptide repeat protein [Pseudodonghicola flavimaris]|uniref:Tetratricopeptide repeat protein n=1 Tax=Pseudodonghicola flavimaris TaxID=3050036 RepID=A0ABT7EXX2_9RHOB|nr:tetratricopeptide repeat protein [Pseudodonghicola flavimaris]MDK3017129.1 tetratricopeptide repeat protein [Pseudodonghicola flavimaris]
MPSPYRPAPAAPRRALALLALAALLSGCGPDRITPLKDSPFAPGIDHRHSGADHIETAHRLMNAGEYELAMDAFARAALADGMSTEILTGLGTANLGLGRLGQAEEMLRRAVKQAPDWPEAWNNLGVVLMERGKTAEAQQIFQRAYALDNGESDAIRDNLRLALAKTEKPANNGQQNQGYKLVRRGSSEFLIRTTP